MSSNIGVVSLTSGSSGNETAQTASVDLRPKQLYVVAIESIASASHAVPTVSGGGLDWELVDSQEVANVLGSADGHLAVYKAHGSGLAGALTITGASGISNLFWRVVSTAASAVVQAVKDDGAGTTPAVTLGAFGSADNGALAFVIAGANFPSGSFTAGSGWTAFATGSFLLAGMWRKDNDTSVDATLGNSGNWGIIALELAPVEYEPEQRVWGVVYAANGTTKVAGLPNIISASVERSVNKLGTWQARIPAVDPAATLLAPGQEVHLYNEGSGIRMRGILEDIDRAVDLNGVHVMVLSGLSLGAELLYQNTYNGISIDDLAQEPALDLVLANADNSWASTVTGSSYLNLTTRFDNMTLWEAVVKLGELSKGYVRETYAARTIEIKNAHTASGIVLANLAAAGPVLGDASKIAPIESIGSVRTDGSGIKNRIVPYGRYLSGAVFDLRNSDRSSPYTIQSRVSPTAPSLVSSGLTRITTTADNVKDLSITVPDAPNRYLIIWVMVDNAEDVVELTVNGTELTALESDAQGNTTLKLYGVVAPPVGATAIHIEIAPDVADPNSGAVYWELVRDVDQINPVRDTNIDSATGTGPSVSVSSDDDDMVFDFVAGDDGTTWTPGASQTVIASNQSWQIGDGKEFGTSYRAGADAGRTMSWTLGASTAHVIGAISLRRNVSYYIEDSTSVTAYRRRVEILTDVDQKADPTAAVAAANTLYDYAVDRLLKRKDAALFLSNVRPATMPEALADAMLPGDSIRVLYKGIVEESDGRRVWLDVDETMIVMTMREVWDGPRRWELGLASAIREDEVNPMVRLSAELAAQQRVANAQSIV